VSVHLGFAGRRLFAYNIIAVPPTSSMDFPFRSLRDPRPLSEDTRSHACLPSAFVPPYLLLSSAQILCWETREIISAHCSPHCLAQNMFMGRGIACLVFGPRKSPWLADDIRFSEISITVLADLSRIINTMYYGSKGLPLLNVSLNVSMPVIRMQICKFFYVHSSL